MPLSNTRFWTGAGIVLAALVAMAFSGINEYVFFAGFVVLQFVVLASAWNILGGYAGYVNFGVPAFVATGAYAALVMFKGLGAPLVVQIVFGAFVAGVLGLLVGLLTLRLRGIFFSIATVAVIFILETVVLNWRFVGGASGLQLSRPGPSLGFESYTRMLFAVMAGVGRPGVGAPPFPPAPRTVSGALLGAGGAPMPMYLSFIEPASSFNLSYAVSTLAMPIIGGLGHWAGPVIGALLLGSLQQIVTVTISSELNVLVVGVLLVVFVVIAPEGILGLVKSWKRSSK
ncbi:MAG TPA: branched-chain amino acid ABC transporter permease [Burkholderiaceae bacterium]|nr:branched-chain amino acid ABC transporter permease [Burkholderiaceae bacterium]